MKRAIFAILTLTLGAFALCSCGSTTPTALVGSWTCSDEAPGCEGGYGYLALDVKEDGRFSLYDTCGNPGIAGTIRGGAEETAGTVEIQCTEEDFDPPGCWEIEERDTLDFDASVCGVLRLGHDDRWLWFTRDALVRNHITLRSHGDAYTWNCRMEGDGLLSYAEFTEIDPEAGPCHTFELTGERAGDVILTIQDQKGSDTRYQVTFYLTVLANGTIIETSCTGDTDAVVTA